MHARPKAALVLWQCFMPMVHKYTQHYETESSVHAKCSIYFFHPYDVYYYLQVETVSKFTN
jgi:hypothetical protein